MRSVLKFLLAVGVMVSVQNVNAGVFFNDNNNLDACVSRVLIGYKNYIYDDGDAFFANQLIICSNQYSQTNTEVNRIRDMVNQMLSN